MGSDRSADTDSNVLSHQIMSRVSEMAGPLCKTRPNLWPSQAARTTIPNQILQLLEPLISPVSQLHLGEVQSSCFLGRHLDVLRPSGTHTTQRLGLHLEGHPLTYLSRVDLPRAMCSSATWAAINSLPTPLSGHALLTLLHVEISWSLSFISIKHLSSPSILDAKPFLPRNTSHGEIPKSKNPGSWLE